MSACWKPLSNDLIHQSFWSCAITGEASVRLHQRLQLILQDEAVNDEDEEASGLQTQKKMKNRMKKQRIWKKLITEH